MISLIDIGQNYRTEYSGLLRCSDTASAVRTVDGQTDQTVIPISPSPDSVILPYVEITPPFPQQHHDLYIE